MSNVKVSSTRSNRRNLGKFLGLPWPAGGQGTGGERKFVSAKFGI